MFTRLTKLSSFVLPKLLNSHHPINLSAVSRFSSALPVTRSYCRKANVPEESSATRTVTSSKDRTNPVPVETSIRYLESEAYQQTYGDEPVWRYYRRNHKGVFAPRKTRRTCIRKGMIATGNPCPICRDEFLVLDQRNRELLKQFISEHTGEVLSYSKTGLCQSQHWRLLIAVQRAKDAGLIAYDVPYVDYTHYYEKLFNKASN